MPGLGLPPQTGEDQPQQEGETAQPAQPDKPPVIPFYRLGDLHRLYYRKAVGPGQVYGIRQGCAPEYRIMQHPVFIPDFLGVPVYRISLHKDIDAVPPEYTVLAGNSCSLSVKNSVNFPKLPPYVIIFCFMI